MFTRNSVILLGAGASCHHGYPSGEELVRNVADRARSLHKRLRSLTSAEWMQHWPTCVTQLYPQITNGMLSFLNDLDQLQNRITQVNPLIIDYFLGLNPNLAPVGKLLIAMELLERERRNPTAPKETSEGKNDWLRFVVHKLTVGCEQPQHILQNKVQFVTFNYDLSLELRLLQALSEIQLFSDSEIAERFINENRIWHVYGQLRPFRTENEKTNLRLVGEDTSTSVYELLSSAGAHSSALKMFDEIDRAYQASLGLKTMAPSEKNNTSDLKFLREAISAADYLYIFGYGFDDANNELIELGKREGSAPTSSTYVYFTNLYNRNKVNKQAERVFGFPQGSLTGDKYVAYNHISFHCEKSIRKVYDALADDFDFIG